MAENPAQWGEATRIIYGVLDEDHKQQIEDAKTGDFRCGNTLPFRIARALKDAGLLTDKDIWKSTPTDTKSQNQNLISNMED